jgi:hypothetical protein
MNPFKIRRPHDPLRRSNVLGQHHTGSGGPYGLAGPQVEADRLKANSVAPAAARTAADIAKSQAIRNALRSMGIRT